MAIISNNPILQNPLAKKAFSKISFEAGEKFNARIVSVDQQKGEVNLKLLDGWQFVAKLDKPLEQGTSGSVLNFEVEGFEEGKLKIKLVYEDSKNVENDILKDNHSGKSLSTDKTDALLFEKMIKHDMPLTKDNITDIKNLVDFKGKISLNGEKEDAFITKYIESRNIDPNSAKANEITKVLKDFFVVLKNLNVDEILLFKENNIGFTKENLESFIKLFKGDSAIYNNLKEINNYLFSSGENKDMQGSIKPSAVSQNENQNGITMAKNNERTSTEGSFIDSKFDNNNNNFKEVVSLINKELKNLGLNHTVSSSIIESLESGEKVGQGENLQQDKKLEPSKNLKLQNESFNKSEIKTLVDKILKMENIKISSDSSTKLIGNLEKNLNTSETFINTKSDNNFKEVVSLINKELKNLGLNHMVSTSTIKSLGPNENLGQRENSEIRENFERVENLQQDKNLEPSKNLKLQIGNFNKGELKTLVDKVLKMENIEISSDSSIKIIDNLEEKLNTKEIEPSSKNLDNIKKNEEIPLNKLDKTTVSDGKIDDKSSTNTKVNGYGKNNSLNEIINMIKKELNFSEIDKKVIDNVEKEIAKTTTDTLIKDQIKLKTGEIKDIVKDIIQNKLNLKPETYEKVIDMFNQKLNDIKIFNSISQQYYYLDLPINVKNDEYQFKLIIKDDRNKGKKIDSTNVKIATSIKTINMGTVDAYIKISNSSMNIDINCNEFFVKVLDISKEKLVKDLSSLSYRVNINVNKKINEFTLAECGEFFNDRSFNAINIKV
ncbi:hypothetical protein LGL08_02595 [Clostridium estertheticum]|uniref:hypothetical protein n=1 Tax=Clostridium estertheticum TaxID=238834 RepID=UPI001CF12F57|nr:hypothetical protein [Clostridium estertheticum]MCB2305188.1 hypothetical protein [Clostridium estertheticum]MCB2343542.1 hypothetical protein [Clostridium estertheticum]MCB2348462.1 hypothetical protein [Clostridium estertheticum]WAG47410.1 hypothetical protein LL127_08135 [Clostridium estertheticum]